MTTTPHPVGWLFDVLGPKNVTDEAGNTVASRSNLRFLGGATVTDNPALGTTDVDLGSSAGGAVVPVPDYIATDNVVLNGAQVVDGASVPNGKLVLCPAQTDTAKSGYWVSNTGGAWTLSPVNNTNAAVAALSGIPSGFAINGTYNKGRSYYLLSGTTVAGAKVWVPTRAPCVINGNEAPWFLKGDDSDETATLQLLAAYITAQPANGGTVQLGRGKYKCTTRLDWPRFWSVTHAGCTATIMHTPGGNGPIDTFRLSWRVDSNADHSGQFSNLLIQNDSVSDTYAPVWAASTAYTVGQYLKPAKPAPYVLLCTQSGTSGARAPLGELTGWSFESKLVGVSNADCSPVWKVITPGDLGTMQFQVSTDGGSTWGATQTTVAQPGRDVYTYTIPGFGTLGIQFADISYPAPATFASTATFSQPAAGAFSPVNVSISDGTGVARGNAYQCTLGGLYQIGVSGVAGACVVSMIVPGVASNAAAATSITARTFTQVHIPVPRIEVIGVPPGADPVVDVASQWGKLGVVQFTVGYSNIVEKNKADLAVSMGALQTTTAGAFSDYAIPGIGGVLTLRMHTGIYSNAPLSTNYWSARPGWSLQYGSVITDGTAKFQIVQGAACIRMNNVGQLTIKDVYLDGGTCNLVVSSGEGVHIEGSGTMKNSTLAALWFSNGDGRYGEGSQITNQNTISGTWAIYGRNFGVLHDGGSAFTMNGAINFSCDGPWLYGAALLGAKLSGIYLECPGGLLRDTSYASGIGTATGARRLELTGGYFGSVSTAYTLDVYRAESPRLSGLWGGSVSAIFTGTDTVDLHIEGLHMKGMPLVTGAPLSGRVIDGTLDTTYGRRRASPPGVLALANGVNSNTAVLTNGSYVVTAPTANYSSTGFVSGVNGQRLRLRNKTVYVYTLSNDVTSTAANRILTGTGADLNLPPGSTVELEYDSTAARWWVVGVTYALIRVRDFTGTTDTPTAADHGGNVNSTGASAAVVTVPVMPAGTCITYSGSGAGLLSFVASGVTLETALPSSGATTAQHQARALFWRTSTNVRMQ